MTINFNRLILLFLPVRLRTVKLFSLMRVLLSPVVTLYATYTAYVDRRRLRLSATPQAAIIERIVFAETGVSISISPNTSSDASPDFYVSYNADATAAQVTAAKSVIDRYKLPSKVYQVQGSVVPYTREWSDFLCSVETVEKAIVIVSPIIDGNNVKMESRSLDYPFILDVTMVVSYRVAYSDNTTVDFNVNIPSGGYMSVWRDVSIEGLTFTISIVSLSYYEDDNYLYSYPGRFVSSYKNTGEAFFALLTIHRKVDGVNISGYPQDFNLLNALPSASLPAISSADFRKLSEADYITRRNAFIDYAKVQTGYNDTVANIASGSIITNTTSCPIDGYVNP